MYDRIYMYILNDVYSVSTLIPLDLVMTHDSLLVYK